LIKDKGDFMKNKLIDLNNHLFAQLERLSDENLTPEKLQQEIQRGQAIKVISREIIDNARLALDAQVLIQEHQLTKHPIMLGIDDGK
jgi:hypothetical protein